jgi:membrane-bound serine protease (ClpP class)
MRRGLLLIFLASLLLLAGVHPLRAEDRPIIVLNVSGVINPLSTQYLRRGLQLAAERDAELLVVVLDTPGGLETAMRDMVQLLLDAPMPTVVFVAPGGARATSAGLFILLAGDVAAMAPATHVGAAHPVPLGADIDDVMDEKMTSDAAALVRSIAATRGRNAEWAESAVRENLSVTAAEARELNVIDLIANDLDDLLQQLDETEVAGVTLQTAGRAVENEPMTLGERLFHIITEPNIAFLLLSLGTLLVLVEVADPGLSVAGVGAAVAFIIAFLGLGNLPVNWAAVALLALSVVLFIIALLTDTEVVVSIAALVPFVLGSLLLFSPFRPASPAAPVVTVSLWLIGVVGAGMVGFSFLVLRAIMAVTHQPPRAGAQRLIGNTGVAITDLAPTGQVRVEHQDWSAVTVADVISVGSPVRVTGIRGVRLEVVPRETSGDEIPLVSPDKPESPHSV